MTWATKIAYMQVVQHESVQSKCKLVRDMCNRQCATDNVQQKMCNRQCATDNVQQTMCNRGNVRLGMCRWYMMRMGVYG